VKSAVIPVKKVATSVGKAACALAEINANVAITAVSKRFIIISNINVK
jgi:hypothetical protein